VWDGVAYKTTGGLMKSELTINYLGKIVSLNKSVYEKKSNRLEQVNAVKSTMKKIETND